MLYKKGDKIRWKTVGYEILGTVIRDEDIKENGDIYVRLEKHLKASDVRLPLSHYCHKSSLSKFGPSQNFVTTNPKNKPELL